MALTAILGIFVLLQYSEEGYLRRNGIRVTATVTELASDQNSCVRCPLEFMIDGERYYVKETIGDDGGEDERKYHPGDLIDLYVDPNDMTHTIAAFDIERNVEFGVFGAVVAAVAVVIAPFWFKREIESSITQSPGGRDDRGRWSCADTRGALGQIDLGTWCGVCDRCPEAKSGHRRHSREHFKHESNRRERAMPAMIAPKVLSWATDLDDDTARQAARSAELPFVFQHVALMPDAHLGYGATVGSVIPTSGAIIPSAVGVDIGCGMIAARLA